MSVLFLIIVAVLIAGDQALKYWVDSSFALGESRDFLSVGNVDLFDLTYVRNNGAIFGSMSGQRWFLIGFTGLVIIGFIIFFFFAVKRSKWLATAVALFVAGGIGNLIDRIRLGYVIDMFDFQLFDFAVFNIADICVTCAFVMLIVYVIFIEPKIAKNAPKTEKKAEDNE